MLRIEGAVEGTRVWLGIFVGAQLADLVTTVTSLHSGGREANPLVSGIIAGGGLATFSVLKLLGVIAVAVLFVGADELRKRAPSRVSNRTAGILTRALQLCVAVQLVAVAQNVVVLGTTLAAGPVST